MALFKNLAIGDRFTFENQLWIKVTPVKKSCCKIIFNAHVDGNKDIKKVFNSEQEVTV
jgi:hypothetical protein